MGLLLAFALGYVTGSRAGVSGLEDLKEAFKELRESEELRALLGVVRSHAGHTLAQWSDFLTETDRSLPFEDLVKRAQRLTGLTRPTWPSS